MTKIQRKAKMLLIELESLRQCGPDNTIAAFALLEEVLKDASALAKHVNTSLPGSFEDKIALIKANSVKANADINEASIRSKKAIERSKAILDRQVFKVFALTNR